MDESRDESGISPKKTNNDISSDISDNNILVSSENVRTRVGAWLTGIVEEVRRKSSSTTIQKWVDNSNENLNNSENQTEVNNLVEIENTEKILRIIEPIDVDCTKFEENIKTENSNEGIESSNIKLDTQFSNTKLWNKFNFDRGHTSSDFSRVTQFKSFSKNKFTALYEKVHKLRYNKVQLKEMENDSAHEIGVEPIIEEKINQSYCEHLDNKENDNLKNFNQIEKNLIKINEIDDEIVQKNPIENLDECHLNISEDDSGFLSFQRNLKFGQRSNTIKSHNTASTSSLKPAISPRGSSSSSSYFIPPCRRYDESTPTKNRNLGSMCRSFSEQQNDNDMIDSYDSFNYLLNERSRSFTHVIGEENLSNNSNNTNNNNVPNNDTVSHSLPNFYDKITARRSPIFRNRLNSNGAIGIGEIDGPQKKVLFRDNSYQSDSSHCSSVDSLLELRKPDSEAILLNLGFGPIESEDVLSKIPKRFLKPSQVKGIDTEAFLRRQQMANHIHDHSILGYRGLVGNPDIPPSSIVAKIMERFEINERNQTCLDNRPQSAPPNSTDNFK